MLEINPFDQPNVQEAKDNTGARARRQGAPPTLEAPATPATSCCDGLEPPRYLAILGYLRATSDEVDAAVARAARALIRDARRSPPRSATGPRYLHSTGQLHKGGPPTGRFLQLVHDGGEDLEIPGRDYGFRHAQERAGDGDLQTLRDHGLPAERVRAAAATRRAGGQIDAIKEML